MIYCPQYHNGKEAGTNEPITEPNTQTGPQQGGLPDPRGRDDQRVSGGGSRGAGVFPDVDRLPGDLRPPARHCHGAVPGGGDGRFTAGLPGGKPCALAGRGSRRALGGQPRLSAQAAPLQGPPAAPDPSGRGAGAEVFRPALREG